MGEWRRYGNIFIFPAVCRGWGFGFRHVESRRGWGYVQNLWDGRVELEAQGEERVIWDLVSMLHKQPYIRIEDMETADMDLKEERGFQMAN